MRLELPLLNTKVDVFVGANPDPAINYWQWSMDPAAQFVQVVAIGAGGGGGSGQVAPGGTVRSGGDGGAGGGYNTGFYPGFMLTPGTLYTIWAGVAGVGGVAVTDADTLGNPGADGGHSQFADLVRVDGGIGGAGGYGNTDNSSAYRPGVYSTPWPGGGGGFSTNTGVWHDGETHLAAGGGGGGGWWAASGAAYDGGQGGWCSGLQSRTGFTAPGEDGANQGLNWPLPSSGGGGGLVGPDGGGNGGGGGGYGGGGGGGAAATNGTPSGGGGYGANGIVAVIQYF